jgi:hypothetical protein
MSQMCRAMRLDKSRPVVPSAARGAHNVPMSESRQLNKVEGWGTGFLDFSGIDTTREGRQDNATDPPPPVPVKVGIIFWTSTISWPSD